MALDEHIHQLEAVLRGSRGGGGGKTHQQYATASGLFDAPRHQRLLGTDGAKQRSV